MDGHRKMEVVDWQEFLEPVISKSRVSHRFLPPTLVGILGTVLLHAVFIQFVSFGSRAVRLKPPETQDSIDQKFSSEDSLALISLSRIANANSTAAHSFVSSLPHLSKMKAKPELDVGPPAFLGLDTLALSEWQAPPAIAHGVNGAEQARLFAVYIGQIQARIDRVWRRPRTPVNEDVATVDEGDAFQCEAQVDQDVKGNVQEVTLLRCNGSPVWQRSLVLAIRQSSPLPAPPSQKVFIRSITLSFMGLTYVGGARDEDYETEQRTSIGAQ
jgi:hypothetical protein